MKDKVRFDRAINALVKGFFNGTLVKGYCTACAVGNMVAESIDSKIFRCEITNSIRSERVNSMWRHVFMTGDDGQQISPRAYVGLAKENIDSTGYSYTDLAKVESAFESNTFISGSKYSRTSQEEIMQDQYNGLMAVVEVLCEIEGIENVSEYKEMFAYKV